MNANCHSGAYLFSVIILESDKHFLPSIPFNENKVRTASKLVSPPTTKKGVWYPPICTMCVYYNISNSEVSALK